MKKNISILLVIIMGIALTACGTKQESAPSEQESSSDSQGSMSQTEEGTQDTGVGETEKQNAEVSESENEISAIQESKNPGSNVLIAYFSVPEDVDTSGVDAIAGASIVVRENEVMGNTEYVAKVVQQTIGGDLFRIETVQQYPLDHDPLVDQAAEEQDEDARPELAAHVENLQQYDYIVLGFPNWWGDMPQPLYTFLEEYDLSGKTIIPFVTHGGSGFSNAVDTIAKLQPDATVSSNTLSLSRNSVADSEADVRSWAESLGINE